MEKNNKMIFWIVGIILVLMIINYNLNYFAVSTDTIQRWKLIPVNIILNPGDCYDHKTIINITPYSKSNNKLFYIDGCTCEYITESGTKGMNINVIISSDYMTYAKKISYATTLKNTLKRAANPMNTYNYKFYVESNKGDCMRQSTDVNFLCTHPLNVFVKLTTYRKALGAPGYLEMPSNVYMVSNWILHELGHSFGLTDANDYVHMDYLKVLNSTQLAKVIKTSSFYKLNICTSQEYLIKKCRATSGNDFYSTSTNTYFCKCPTNYKWDDIKGCIK